MSDGFDWKTPCEAIVAELNGASYTGSLVITDQATRAYLPRFDDQRLSDLQVVVAPIELDITLQTRARRRTLDGMSVGVHIVSKAPTIDIDEIDAVFDLAGEVASLLTRPGKTFGGKTIISAGVTAVFDREVFERHLAVWVTPVFGLL